MAEDTIPQETQSAHVPSWMKNRAVIFGLILSVTGGSIAYQGHEGNKGVVGLGEQLAEQVETAKTFQATLESISTKIEVYNVQQANLIKDLEELKQEFKEYQREMKDEFRSMRNQINGGNHNNNRININSNEEPLPEIGTWVSTARYAEAHGITKDGAYYRKDNGLAATRTLDNGRLQFLFEGIDYAETRHKLGTNSAEN